MGHVAGARVRSAAQPAARCPKASRSSGARHTLRQTEGNGVSRGRWQQASSCLSRVCHGPPPWQATIRHGKSENIARVQADARQHRWDVAPSVADQRDPAERGQVSRRAPPMAEPMREGGFALPGRRRRARPVEHIPRSHKPAGLRAQIPKEVAIACRRIMIVVVDTEDRSCAPPVVRQLSRVLGIV
jgi:hypothetical protein